jgi:hypothetical protein
MRGSHSLKLPSYKSPVAVRLLGSDMLNIAVSGVKQMGVLMSDAEQPMLKRVLSMAWV